MGRIVREYKMRFANVAPIKQLRIIDCPALLRGINWHLVHLSHESSICTIMHVPSNLALREGGNDDAVLAEKNLRLSVCVADRAKCPHEMALVRMSTFL